MEYVIQSKDILSTDKKHTLKGIMYIPQGEIKAIFHIVHGMCEYMGRYDNFMKYMAENGYLCCGYNHVGHKDTSPDEELGFFADEKGDDILIDDVYEFAKAIKAEYPDLKYILMGHSMGSFVVRLSAARYNEHIDGLIVMGTSGPNPAAKIGLGLCNLKIKCGGAHRVSGLVYSMAFGSYNKKTEKRTPSDWITKDTAIVDKYCQDKYCMFKFTNSAMRDLIKMNYESNLDDCMKAYPEKLPILLISGNEDPVGSYGVGVKQVFDIMTGFGKNVSLKLYDGMRHEVLNEIDRKTVYADLLNWVANI